MRNDTRPLGLATIFFAACALALAGCGHTSTTSATLGRAEFEFLAGGGVAPQSQQYLFTATQELTRRCMSAHGYRYYPAKMAAPPRAIALDNELTFDGKAPAEAPQLAERQAKGYGVYESFTEAHAPEGREAPENDVYVRSLPPTQQEQYMRTLDGDSSQRATGHPPGGPAYSYVTGGCTGQVDREIYGSAQAANSIVTTPQAIRLQLVNATEADPAVIRATGAWSRCIAQKTGREFTNPPAIVNWLSRQYSRGGPSATLRDTEIELAVADTRCAYSGRLAQTYSTTFRRRADHLPPSLQGALLAMLEQNRKAAQRAQAILAAER